MKTVTRIQGNISGQKELPEQKSNNLKQTDLIRTLNGCGIAAAPAVQA